MKRCPICNWPLGERMEDGCVEGDCSMRPPPKRAQAVIDPWTEYQCQECEHYFAVRTVFVNGIRSSVSGRVLWCPHCNGQDIEVCVDTMAVAPCANA